MRRLREALALVAVRRERYSCVQRARGGAELQMRRGVDALPHKYFSRPWIIAVQDDYR